MRQVIAAPLFWIWSIAEATLDDLLLMEYGFWKQLPRNEVQECYAEGQFSVRQKHIKNIVDIFLRPL